jgi:hypothetical protein
VTSLSLVPVFASDLAISPRTSWHSSRRSPARDIAWGCPNFAMISSIVSRDCSDSPARDIGGPAPSFDARRSLSRRLRARSSFRAKERSASRRAFSCLARRRSRHCFPHVFWVFFVDGAGVYHLRHSLQRRRGDNLLLGLILGLDLRFEFILRQLPKLIDYSIFSNSYPG